ncbi:MAG: DUF4403 family protein [Chitinophagaceae bacterium]|nr:MAG: DUF4403 family protein [Chitinophagaceae bacterium]
MLLKRLFLFCSGMISVFAACAQTDLVDSLPESQIDIPIQINLKPIFALAERNVDTAFTSPNYPNDWVQADCATRYKYHFRRSPLRMTMKGIVMNLGFTGYYQIVGSTRLCNGNTVLSPWSPGCRCGFDEAERQVEIGFISSFSLSNDFRLQTRTSRMEPVAKNKCEVCFWGQDVTKEVINGLKAELDLSRKAMQDSFGNINLRPYMQQAWNMLNETYAIPGIGYFSLHPKRLRMQNINAQKDLLNINIGITASPAVTFEKPTGEVTQVPNLTTSANPGGFTVYLDAALQYDSLSRVVNGYMAGKRFDVSEGIFKKHIVVKEVTVAASPEGRMLIKVDFTGSFNGTAFFTGNPVYNPASKTIEVQDLDYDLQTKNLLLKTAKWLFSGKIESELKKNTTINLTTYFEEAQKSLNTYLNKEWTKGIRGVGNVKDLKVVSVQPLPQHILIKSACSGNLSVKVTEID